MIHTEYSLKREYDAEILPALEETFYSANILTVTAGTNGYCGGDSGHGGKSFVKFKMESGDMGVSIDNAPFSPADEITISVGGDCELETLIEGLRFAAMSLEAIGAIKSRLLRND